MPAVTIAAWFEASCREELDGLKPGNVHRFSAGHCMDVVHFERAAAAAAPLIAQPDASVGARIEAAVNASFGATGLNTNLGIVLLCAPLASAAERGGILRTALQSVLDGLTVEDAAAAFRAIVRANPGGLGRTGEHDVAEAATITLKQAMAAAADRDRIARQYVSGFADIFTVGLPCIARVPPDARAEAVHLAFMAAFPDSHIQRKFGLETARRVQQEAREVDLATPWREGSERRHPVLAAFDASLKARGLNPGTSADLTVATLFVARLEGLINP
nr:triphosphoribosyl-dephospho-CoA synthase [Ancylobacter crimeensis]